ncbi:MAG: radical SAM protein [Treponema sp.]|jgi:putative pyruvate formate lyase activating enzyme|nr:radical SAM protein [Treponema sp.]
MRNLYKNCHLCPRSCNIDRTTGEEGFCKESASLRVASAVLHKGEEPPLVGKGGSGTIFISGCNLGCAFCQNYQISQGLDGKQGLGREVSSETFAKICLTLQERGAENVNIVTGSHAVPAIIQGLETAKKAGLRIPVLWNSSAYETVKTLGMLRDYVDIYLPDLKTLDSAIAAKFFKAPDYPDAATAAILEMINTAKRGKKVIVRHLILPDYLESTRKVLRWFAENAKSEAQSDAQAAVELSLMTQYAPIPGLNQMAPQRFLSGEDYGAVLEWLSEYGIEDGFCQELVTGSGWLPDFKRSNPFSSELSIPVWHYGSSFTSPS